MAVADYKLCAHCGRKGVYDADWFERLGKDYERCQVLCEACRELGYKLVVRHGPATASARPGQESSPAGPAALEDLVASSPEGLEELVASSALRLPKLTVPDVVRAVAGAYGTTPEKLRGRSRCGEVLHPRQAAMWLAWRYTDASVAEIGRAFNRHSPAVRNAVRRIEAVR